MSGRRMCSVLNCGAHPAEVIMHRFPKPGTGRFFEWLRASGNKRLLDVDHEQLNKSYSICRKHFASEFLMHNNRLSFAAVPTLFLPEPIEVPTVADSSSNLPALESQQAGDILDPAGASTSGLQAEVTGDNAETTRSTSTLVQPDAVGVRRRLFNVQHKHSTSKRSILGLVGENVSKNLTPRKKKLYDHIIQLRKKHSKCVRKNASLKMRVKECQGLLSSRKLDFLDDTQMDSLIKNFLKSQYLNFSKKNRGKRFTLEDKVLSVSIYKQSPKAYNFLSKIFCLPSPQTLRDLLQHVPIKPGICEPIFRNLAVRAAKLSLNAKLCVLMFDEMSLHANFQYSKSKDFVEGFVDDGFERHHDIADHVTVWMLKGIYSKWKQPVAYTFCKSSASATDIVHMFKTVVRETHNAGFTIIASICDQGATNASAIKQLLKDTRGNVLRLSEDAPTKNIILIDNIQVIPLFDPPHLLKCIRNNLITKNLKFILDGVAREAKWSHIIDAYHIDVSTGDLRIMPKLSEFHVVPGKIRKMKVSICTQVFSASVAAGINNYSESGKSVGIRKVGVEGKDTALLCSFLDKLFDSLNGGFKSKVVGKSLRLPVQTTTASPQATFWSRAINVLQGMSYVKGLPNDRARPPVLDNFILTLRGFQLVREVLRDLGCKFFAPRSFNQDPVENFFGQVRQRGCRNINPTVADFGPYYKSLLVNTISTVHSRGSNCEADDSGTMLVALQHFITQGIEEEIGSEPDDAFLLPPDDLTSVRVNLDALTYVSGYIAKAILPMCHKCDTCSRNVMHQGEPLPVHTFTISKEYENCALVKCNANFISALHSIHSSISWYLPQILYRKHVGQHLQDWVKMLNYFEYMEICEHVETIKRNVVCKFVILSLFNYCRILNRILAGKETPTDNMDSFKDLVYKFYKSHLKKKK